MTLIVGVLCSDGLAVGADSAATFATTSGVTIRHTVTKLQTIQDQLLLACSGGVGPGQLVAASLEEMWRANELSGKHATQWMSHISDRIAKMTETLRIAATQAQGVISQFELQESRCYTLLAGAPKRQPCLIKFNSIGAPEMATEDLPFVALGYGQPIADPFLAFVKRIFWPSRLPTLAEGTFAACWTLTHAFETTPGFVAGPIQMAVLHRTKGGDLRARLMTAGECEEHQQAVTAVEEYIARFRTEMTHGEAAREPPTS